MKMLLTNDDGIAAPGLRALEQACRRLGEAVTLAPEQHHSGCSHRTTTDRPLHVAEMAPQRFALDGAPADCARIGVLALAPDAKWLLAGVNDGANLGVDVYMSGTAAAAREAALLGKPAVALSQYRLAQSEIDWEKTARMAARVLDELLRDAPHPGAFWNVNFPDPADAAEEPDIVFCPLDPHALPVAFEKEQGGYQYQGDYHQRKRIAGGDVDVCFSGRIAVTLILPTNHFTGPGGAEIDHSAPRRSSRR